MNENTFGVNPRRPPGVAAVPQEIDTLTEHSTQSQEALEVLWGALQYLNDNGKII